MLARMYRRWAERRGYVLQVIEYTEGEEAGIKSATYSVAGEYAFRDCSPPSAGCIVSCA
jgi:peptide chain release factor 2